MEFGYGIADIRRGKHSQKVTVRFDPNNILYLTDKGIRVPGDLEYQLPSGTWACYPSAMWVDMGGAKIYTLVLVQGEDGLEIWRSPDGEPDRTLYCAVKDAGLYVQ